MTLNTKKQHARWKHASIQHHNHQPTQPKDQFELYFFLLNVCNPQKFKGLPLAESVRVSASNPPFSKYLLLFRWSPPDAASAAKHAPVVFPPR